MDEMMNLGEG